MTVKARYSVSSMYVKGHCYFSAMRLKSGGTVGTVLPPTPISVGGTRTSIPSESYAYALSYEIFRRRFFLNCSAQLMHSFLMTPLTPPYRLMGSHETCLRMREVIAVRRLILYVFTMQA